MKKLICLALLVISACVVLPASAQDKAAKFEYAIVKWDGPDRLYKNLPGNKLEVVKLDKIGITVPKDAMNEEFCLSVAANLMAKDGWEPINLNSRRILFRRPVFRPPVVVP